MASVSVDEYRVLHVEDDPDFADLVATFLERENEDISVVTEHDAAAGLERLHEVAVDCVVSDYDLPGEDGLEFLRSVRETRPELPFILFTGHGSEQIASKAISAGVTDYLDKGGGTDQYTMLANRVTNAVEAATATRRLERREREYRTLMERSPIPTVIFDRSGELVYANPSAIEFTEVDEPEQLIGSSADEFVHPADQDASVDRLERVLAEREPVEDREYRIVTSEGDTRYAQGTLVPVTYEGEPAAQAVLVDVTAYKDAADSE